MVNFVATTRRWYGQGKPERCRRMLRLPNAARWGAAEKAAPCSFFALLAVIQKRRTPSGPPFRSAIRRKIAYSATIAPVGQAPSQAPQSMQAPASTTATPSSTFTAPTGQAPSQAPQPMQPSVTLCAIVELSFRPVPNNLSRGTFPQRCAPARPQPASLCTDTGAGVRLCADCSKDKPKRQD